MSHPALSLPQMVPVSHSRFRCLSFFPRVLFSKEYGNNDRKAAKARTFFPLFLSHPFL
jgi:hypothetical protein